MSASPVLDFQVFQQEKHWELFCQMMHKALDRVLSGLKDSFLTDKPLVLKEISDLLQGKKQEFGSYLLQEFIHGQYGPYLEQEWAICPCCGKKIRRNTLSERTIETLLGLATLNRPYFYCRRCKYGFAPLDEALELYKVGELQFADDPDKALHWVEATMTRLHYKGGISHVIGGLKRMHPRDEDAKKQIEKTITYLTNNKGRTGYKGAKIGGYPIGSGGIESANKFICHVRLKRSGAWWLKSNCNSMLKLRCSIVNGTFDDLFAKSAAWIKVNNRVVRNA